jgi:hypothetical protein
MQELIPVERIESKIFIFRGQKVMLDRDLAMLYEVTTSNLNKAVKRNIERFSEDFMFKLTKEEFQNLIFHFGTSSWGGVRKMPYAFTEQGVAMLSSVLKSDKAIKVNIQIMRAFTKLRGMLVSYEELKQAIIDMAKKHDEDVTYIFMELDRLNRILELKDPRRRIGFKKDNQGPSNE